MKREEELAHRYLVSLGQGPVIYEPEPNLPPDFLINGTIVVEVRRLNQNEITDSGDHRGLEETSIPFNMRFQKLLASFGPPQSGATWFVSYRIRRPIKSWKELRPVLKRHLARFLEESLHEHVEIPADESVEISFFPASDVHNAVFICGTGSDDDSGGFVVHEMLKNLSVCVEEKSLVVAPHRHKYREWWLVFVDYIGYGLVPCDQEMLLKHWKMEHDWDRMILINPLSPLSAFELKTSKFL